MPVEITMPQLSDTMAEGTLIKWHKKEGDKVSEGDVIAEVETDKANMDMEAFESGTVALLAVQEGQKVKVGERMAVLAGAGEDPVEVKKQFAAGGAVAPVSAQPATKPPVGGAAVRGMGAQGAAAQDTELGRGNIEEGRARSRQESVQAGPEHTSEALSREATALVGKGRPATGEAGERVKVSPLAKRIATQMDVDLTQVRGTGPGGRIVQRDVETVAKAASVAAPAPVAGKKPVAGPAISLAPRVATGQTEVFALTRMRSVIAQRLQQSKQTIPHFYETIDIDVEELTQLRARLNKPLEKEDVRLSLQDLVAKGVAISLVSHPALNATFDGKEITRHGDVNLGIAVALPDGLIVPVLRNVNQMGLREIRVRSADLIERARVQKLKQEELSGATFTISNLGAFGIRDFTAIINPPEVGILAIGAAEKRPVVVNDQIVPRTMMSVTLSADHRAVDGATAAEFLRTLKQLLEEPGMMLV